MAFNLILFVFRRDTLRQLNSLTTIDTFSYLGCLEVSDCGARRPGFDAWLLQEFLFDFVCLFVLVFLFFYNITYHLFSLHKVKGLRKGDESKIFKRIKFKIHVVLEIVIKYILPGHSVFCQCTRTSHSRNPYACIYVYRVNLVYL